MQVIVGSAGSRIVLALQGLSHAPEHGVLTDGWGTVP